MLNIICLCRKSQRINKNTSGTNKLLHKAAHSKVNTENQFCMATMNDLI